MVSLQRVIRLLAARVAAISLSEQSVETLLRKEMDVIYEIYEFVSIQFHTLFITANAQEKVCFDIISFSLHLLHITYITLFRLKEINVLPKIHLMNRK